jgi:hypothetical protein
MQVADVNGIRRTIIPSPENRKVGGSTPPLSPPLAGALVCHVSRGEGQGLSCPVADRSGDGFLHVFKPRPSGRGDGHGTSWVIPTAADRVSEPEQRQPRCAPEWKFHRPRPLGDRPPDDPRGQ